MSEIRKSRDQRVCSRKVFIVRHGTKFVDVPPTQFCFVSEKLRLDFILFPGHAGTTTQKPNHDGCPREDIVTTQ